MITTRDAKMMAFEHAVVDDLATTSPGSPPGMTASKSSKSSSTPSLSSDDASVLADVNHFEEIGLEDDGIDPRQLSDDHFKTAPNPYSPNFSSDMRTTTIKHKPASSPRLGTGVFREYVPKPGRPDGPMPLHRSRPSYPSLKPHVKGANARSANLAVYPHHMQAGSAPHPLRTLGSRSTTSLSLHRHRSPSPSLSLNPRDPNTLMKPRRSSWQSTQDRKSVLELELECDEDDGDDIPDGLVLDNVPISPRPPQERSKSQPGSKTTSPERKPKERIRSVGNGTPAIAVAHGSLRSPTWKSETAISDMKSLPTSAATSPIKSRTHSWSAAMAGLSSEVKMLTEKLEEHADEIELKMQRASTGSMPAARKLSDSSETRQRVRSVIVELPPLRKTNIMIDPLPISKEKEAVLSRTRPSWLPPKDPAEEKRHLKEWQRMMAQSAEADRRREANKKIRSECRDTAADSLMHIWEEDIIPKWNEAIRERRTRELWWHGIAPRSRGAVWLRAIGNELGLRATSYQAALGRARETEARIKAGNGTNEDKRHAASFEAIRKDVEENTLLDMKIFQLGGPLHDNLVDVLSAYAMYRSDIGYVSGCNTIVALLLINMPSPTDAFIALANVLNRPIPLSFYARDPGAKSSAYNLILQMLAAKSPNLHDHLTKLPQHDAEEYLNGIYSGLFTNHLSLDEAARLWDVYVFEGDTLLIRAGVALLIDNEMSLLGTKSMAEVRAVLDQGAVIREKKKRAMGGTGEEDRWMRTVREAGKS